MTPLQNQTMPEESRELLALRRGVYSTVTADGVLHLIAWPHSEAIGLLSEGQQAMLRVLAKANHTAERLMAICRDHDGDDGADLAGSLIARLRSGGWLKVTVTWEGRELYCLEPIRAPIPRPEKAGSPLVLSRFAMLRRREDGLVTESPRAWCDVWILDPAVLSVVAELAATGLAGDAGAAEGALPVAAIQRLLLDLRWAEIAVPVPDEEDNELRLRQWSPHELWFHQRSRVGERGYFGMSFGRTSWAKGTFDPLPARREPYPGPAIDLYRPDLDKLRATDPTLTTVLEDRQSVRSHDSEPLTADQLGEFLYRCARTRGTRVADGVEYASRPHPSGGSVYELELYPLVRHVAGLEPGFYHYDSMGHQLRLVQQYAHPATRRLMAVAKLASLMDDLPQMVIVIAARVGRLMWTYEAMPYAMILKHVGVMYQTMYCVATAMDLAPCGMGSGDSVAFSEATGMDPFTECGVGEFVLGRRPADVPRRRSAG